MEEEKQLEMEEKDGEVEGRKRVELGNDRGEMNERIGGRIKRETGN